MNLERPTPYEVSAPEWPTATQDLLADHEKLEATHGAEQVNQPLFALIKARKALTDARLALDRAAQFYAALPTVRDRLSSISAALKQEHERFPLHVINKRRTWRDQVAWAKPLVAPEVMTTEARKRAVKLERPLSDGEAAKLLHSAVREMLGKEGIG